MIPHLLGHFWNKYRETESLTGGTLGHSPLHDEFWGQISAYGCLAIGVALFLYFFLLQLPLAIESKDWTPTLAWIHKSEMVRDGKSQQLEFAFTYTVDNRTYRNYTIELVRESIPFSHTTDHSVLDDFPQGKQATVYVSPTDPTKAVARPGIRTSVYFTGNLWAIAFTLYGLFRYWRLRSSNY